MGTTKVQYDIGGMSCSFCAESIRKAYERTEGIEEVNVSLAYEEVRIRYDDSLSEVELKDTLRDLGYTIRDPDKQKRFEEQREEVKQAKWRLTLAGAASLVTAGLMLFMIFIRGAFESADIVLMGDRLGGVTDAYEIGKSSYRKTKQNLAAAFSFNGIGVAAATTGLVHPVFAMIAMMLSVSVVLANSFAGQLVRDERLNTDFAVETDTSAVDTDVSTRDGARVT